LIRAVCELERTIQRSVISQLSCDIKAALAIHKLGGFRKKASPTAQEA
jgi:hypothetical protein